MIMSLTGTKTTSQTTQTEKNSLNQSAVAQTSTSEETSNISTKLAQLFSKYENTLSSDDKAEITAFYNNSDGTESEKLATVEMALSKGITLTASNLESVQTALYEAQYTSEQIDALTKESRTDRADQTSDDAKLIIENLKLPDAIKEALTTLVDNGSTLKEALSYFTSGEGSISDMLNELQTTLKTNFDSLLAVAESLIENVATPETEAENNLQSALDNSSIAAADITRDNEKVPTSQLSESKNEYSSTLSQVFSEPPDLEVLGEEVKSEGEDSSADNMTSESAEDSDASESSDTSLELPDEITKMIDEGVEAVLSQLENQIASLSENFEIKTYLVTETTEKTIAMKAEFTAFQNEVAELLNNAEALDKTSLEETISKAIEQIDKMITKEAVTLYSSMQTERDLLVLSSELREASNLLENGDTEGAIAIVKKGYETISSLTYNPDKTEVMAFVTGKADAINMTFNDTNNTSKQQILDMMATLSDEEGVHHARDVVETLRFLGNNHETEVANYVESKDRSGTEETIQSNVKEILLKLMKEETDQRTVENAEKSLMNLSGQQMMNDSQGQGQRQLYYFNYPINDAEELGEMKIYVTGNEYNQGLDWQNTELYFGMDLQNQGKTGIKITVSGGDMTIKVMNDATPEIAENVANYQSEFETIGFKNVSVISERYEKTEIKVDLSYDQEPSMNAGTINQSEGGIDFKV